MSDTPAHRWTVQVTDLTKEIEIEGRGPHYLVPVKEAERLLAENIRLKRENAELSHDIADLKEAVVAIIKLFGLLDESTGTIKASIQNGSEGWTKYVLKALNRIIWLVTTSAVSKGAEAELMDMFAFITKVIPLINKYAGTGNNSNAPRIEGK